MIYKNESLDNITNTYYETYYMLKMLTFFYKKFPIPKMEGTVLQRTHKKIHVPSSYCEYIQTLHNEKSSLNQDHEWGFFVDIDQVPKVILHQKNGLLPLKIEYSYFKYVKKYTYFRSNKIVIEDEKYSSVESFNNICCGEEVCVEESKSKPSVVRQPTYPPYVYSDITTRRPKSSPRNRWYSKLTLLSVFVIACMSCATFIVCIVFV